MIRRTFGQAKTELARTAGATGMAVADDAVMAYTNQATEELMNEGDWPSVVDRLRFRIARDKCRFVLPSDYDRMLYCTLDQVPLQMQSPWFEFVAYGLDYLNQTDTEANWSLFPRFQGVLDKDAVVTFEDIPTTGGPWYLRVSGTVDEKVDGVRPTIIVQGYDTDKNWIRSQVAGEWIDGIAVAINGDTQPFFAQTTQAFSYITGIIKPVTKGNVLLHVANSDQSTIEYIGQYAPKDTAPFYRQYSVPDLRQILTAEAGTALRCRTIVARCRKRYVPVTDDNDWLLIGNLPALKKMVQAVYFSEAQNYELYAVYKAQAVEILQKEAKAYVGLQRQKPLFTFTEGLGIRQEGVYIQ